MQLSDYIWSDALQNRQPQFLPKINYLNPISKNIIFAYLPGFLNDITGSYGNGVIRSSTTKIIGSYIQQPGNASDGLLVGNSALLGVLQYSTVIGLFSTKNLSAIGGSAIYSERAPSGSDIYKICFPFVSSQIYAEFTYRNDANNLIQLRAACPANIANGTNIFGAIVNNNGNMSVFANGYLNNGIYANQFSFSNPGINRIIGADISDTSASWNGNIYYVCGFNRALSINELTSLYNNPWQIFSTPMQIPL